MLRSNALKRIAASDMSSDIALATDADSGETDANGRKAVDGATSAVGER
jgi:hypothetical protein